MLDSHFTGQSELSQVGTRGRFPVLTILRCKQLANPRKHITKQMLAFEATQTQL